MVGGGEAGLVKRFHKAVSGVGKSKACTQECLNVCCIGRIRRIWGGGDPQVDIGWSPTTVSQFVHLEPRGYVYQAMGSGPTGRVGVLGTVPGWGELWCPQFPKLLTTFLSLQGCPAHLVSYPFLPSLSFFLHLDLVFCFQGARRWSSREPLAPR